MQSIFSGFMRVRVAVVIGVMFAGTLGLLSTQVVAHAADSVDLTTFSDDEISAYRWQAMAKFYAGQPAPQDLTTLSDDEISAYRWQAMAKFYAGQPAPQILTTLSDDEVSAYRWQAMARFFADQAAPTALTLP